MLVFPEWEEPGMHALFPIAYVVTDDRAEVAKSSLRSTAVLMFSILNVLEVRDGI